MEETFKQLLTDEFRRELGRPLTEEELDFLQWVTSQGQHFTGCITKPPRIETGVENK